MLGDRLRELRESKKLTQDKLADVLGISRGTYAHYEINKRKPDYDMLIKIADFYGVSTDYLLRGIDPKVQDKIFIDEAKRLLYSKEATITPLDGKEVTDEMLSAALEMIAEQLKNRRKPGDVKSGKYPSKKPDDER
ncbi:helix-turn-helix transcriptional regulator [Bacillus licheniformis]|uniref:helix-turn-helix domain-containing protein n=1 Tax=Bacillus licheniformis TaxID=1402 RepID=UPI0011A0C5A5|nr:helix-turn-helix transcriptional regulator [Bacillus licheniformis]MCY7743686.1 helix-turn-helix transcriptional regulator [Bacillus licheniformis]TWL30565.1 HTH-type transcriptional regulator Xre [Bacillus licheniformis]